MDHPVYYFYFRDPSREGSPDRDLAPPHKKQKVSQLKVTQLTSKKCHFKSVICIRPSRSGSLAHPPRYLSSINLSIYQIFKLLKSRMSISLSILSIFQIIFFIKLLNYEIISLINLFMKWSLYLFIIMYHICWGWTYSQRNGRDGRTARRISERRHPQPSHQTSLSKISKIKEISYTGSLA